MSVWLPNIYSFVQAPDMFGEAMTSTTEDRIRLEDFLSPELQNSLPRAEMRFPLFTILPFNIPFTIEDIA
jgi:hypothetical protein